MNFNMEISLWVNTMAADALIPHVTRTSTTILLNVQYKWALVFHMVGFQLTVPSVSQYYKMLENVNVFL